MTSILLEIDIGHSLNSLSFPRLCFLMESEGHKYSPKKLLSSKCCLSFHLVLLSLPQKNFSSAQSMLDQITRFWILGRPSGLQAGRKHRNRTFHSHPNFLLLLLFDPHLWCDRLHLPALFLLTPTKKAFLNKAKLKLLNLHSPRFQIRSSHTISKRNT